MQEKGDRLKRGDLSLEDLEKKLKKHLRDWKRSHEKETAG